MTNADSKLAALQRAYDRGHPEIALMSLAGSVRIYTRTTKSKPGWQVADYRRPYPRGTAAVVLVDSFATGKPEGFYVVPVAEIAKIIMDAFHAAFPDGVRPISPESTHAVVSPDSVRQHRDRWDFWADIAD
jgi:hypothetical protein